MDISYLQSLLVVIVAAICFYLSYSFSFTSAQFVTKHIISFCTGAVQSCAVFDNNRLKCWGQKYSWGMANDISDDLGDSMSELGDNIPYIDVGTKAAVVQVSCGLQHICIRLSTNQMKCLGINNKGQIGLGITTSPIGAVTGYIGDNLPAVNLGIGLEVLGIESGYYASCAKVTGNRLKCFGHNQFGQLGVGDANNRGLFNVDIGFYLFANMGTDVEVDYVRGSGVGTHFCAVLSAPLSVAQRFKCWGNGFYYQLGYGDANNRGDGANEMGDNLPLVDLGIESRIRQIITGGDHTCVILINDELRCWGRGEDSSFPSGSEEYVISPKSNEAIMLLDPGKTVKLISGGSQRTCIVYDDFVTMKCSGLAYLGQIGSGDSLERGDTPDTRFPNISAIPLGTGSLQISSIYSGDAHNCVIFVDNSVKCFGYNFHGEMGIGSVNDEIGDDPNEMGDFLPFTMLFSPTRSPTPPTLPTLLPTKSPSVTPTTVSPTSSPTVHVKLSNNSATVDSNQNLIISLSVLIPVLCICSMLGCMVTRMGKTNNQKRFLLYVSYNSEESKSEVDVLIKDFNRRKQRGEKILVSDKDRDTLKMTSKWIKQSRVVVFVLSEKLMKSSRFLIDLNYAYEHKVDILLIEIVGTRVSKDTLISYLDGLTDDEYKLADPEGSVRLTNQKISIESHKRELVWMLLGFAPYPFKLSDPLDTMVPLMDEIWSRIRRIAPVKKNSVFNVAFYNNKPTQNEIDMLFLNDSSQLQAEAIDDITPVMAQEIDEPSFTNERHGPAQNEIAIV